MCEDADAALRQSRDHRRENPHQPEVERLLEPEGAPAGLAGRGPAGTLRSGHTTDSSSGVRVTQENGALVAQREIPKLGSSLQTSSRSPPLESCCEALGAPLSAVMATRRLLDAAGWTGARAADVGDEPRDLLGCGVIRGDG